MSYEETMSLGVKEYLDVLARLTNEGLPAELIQTGGMCAAIEVHLETGHMLLITDASDTLSWARAEHECWGSWLVRAGGGTRMALWRTGRPFVSDVESLLILVGGVIFRRNGTAVG